MRCAVEDPSIFVSSLAAAGNESVESFVEGRIVGCRARIAEAPGHIYVLEIIALKTYLFRGVVVAKVTYARIAKDAVACGIRQPPGQ